MNNTPNNNKKNRFPLGFWNYVDIAHQGPEAVQDWADAGMTLALGPRYIPDATTIPKMRAILDAAAQKGIRVLLCDLRAEFPNLKEVGEPEYRRQMQETLTAFGDHPAVMGMHIGDEPAKDMFDVACRALRIHKELAPHLTPFLNLLQWNLSVHTSVGYEHWEDYLEAYLDASEADLLAYDCYSQMIPDEAGHDMYFRNLRMFEEAARKRNIPFWPSQLSVGVCHYQVPDEDALRWQLNTAIAHGAKGVLWFFFYMREPHANFRLAPIDEHDHRTPTFDALARVQQTFLKWQADTVQGLTLRSVHHFGKAWGGVPLMDTAAGPIGRVAAVWTAIGTDCNPEYRNEAAPLIVSQFTDSQGKHFVMLVNSSMKLNAWAFCRIVCGKGQITRIGWKGAEQMMAKGDGSASNLMLQHWLAPGQMELFRIDEESQTVK